MDPSIQRTRNSPFLSYALILVTALLIQDLLQQVDYRLWLSIFTTSLLALLAVHCRMKPGLRKIRIISLICYGLLFFFGLSHGALSQERRPELPGLSEGTFTGRVSEILSSGEKAQRILVQVEGFRSGDSLFCFNETVVLTCSDTLSLPDISPGKKVLFDAKLNLITGGGNPGQFDYQRYMQLKGVFYQGLVSQGMLVVENSRITLKTRALMLREQLARLYRKIPLTNDELGVLSALTLGDRVLLSAEMRNSFAASGTMHVLAVSGLHVGIISILFGRILMLVRWGKRGKIIRAGLVILLLWGYAFLTGLSPSVMRAATMFTFVELGKPARLKGNIFNTLGASAFFLLLIRPSMLFDVGFQLSYLAVMSIAVYQPLVASLFHPKNRLVAWAWEMLAVSFAAQLGTTPISLFYFHQFPTYFWLSNFFVIPASVLLLYAATAYLLLAFLPFAVQLLGFMLKWSVAGMIWVVKTIESIPGALIEGIWITPYIMVLLYLILASLTLALVLRSVAWLKTVLVVMILTIAGSCLTYWQSSRQRVVVVYNSAKTPLVSLIIGKDHYYYSFTPDSSKYELDLLKYASGYFHTRVPEPCSGKPDGSSPLCCSRSFLVAGPISFEWTSKPLKTDSLYLADLVIDRYKRVARVNQVFRSEKGIYFKKMLGSEGNFTYLHELKEKGAIVLRF